jgi:hypothetical protein
LYTSVFVRVSHFQYKEKPTLVLPLSGVKFQL